LKPAVAMARRVVEADVFLNATVLIFSTPGRQPIGR